MHYWRAGNSNLDINLSHGLVKIFVPSDQKVYFSFFAFSHYNSIKPDWLLSLQASATQTEWIPPSPLRLNLPLLQLKKEKTKIESGVTVIAFKFMIA